MFRKGVKLCENSVLDGVVSDMPRYVIDDVTRLYGIWDCMAFFTDSITPPFKIFDFELFTW